MKSAVCVLCGNWRPITREHVPPKNLFLPPRPRNTITVPLCSPCNKAFDRDDEYFRIYITMGAEPGTKLARLWKERVLESTLHRSPRLKSKLGEDRNALRALHVVEPILLSDNTALPDHMLPLAQPFSVARINAVVQKIVQCLHFHHTGARLDNHASFTVSNAPLDEDDVEKLRVGNSGAVGHDGEFIYVMEELDARQTKWLLWFYERHSFKVVVSRPSSIERATQ